MTTTPWTDAFISHHQLDDFAVDRIATCEIVQYALWAFEREAEPLKAQPPPRVVRAASWDDAREVFERALACG